MEELIKYIKQQISEGEKALKELDEAIRLAELMGIDVSEQKARRDEAYARLTRYKEGLEAYVKYRGGK